jgi:hypothetical protein
MRGAPLAEESSLNKIIVAVIIALAVGSSSPWWWKYVSPPSPTPTPTPARQSPYMGELMYGINFQGRDIDNLLTAQTEGACSESCRKNDRCKAMTFVKNPTGSGGVCWLKDAVSTRSKANNMISAQKIYP